MIERPKLVQKSDKGYLTNEQYQNYSEEQFNNIYDYLGEVLFDDSKNTKTTFNFSESLLQYSALEIWYRAERESYEIRGSQMIQNPVGSTINIHTLYRSTSTKLLGTTSLYQIDDKKISLVAGGNYEIVHGQVPAMNTNNSTYITKIIGRKEK